MAAPSDSVIRVLVVDDNRSIYKDIRKILSPADHRETALDKAAAQLFDDAPQPQAQPQEDAGSLNDPTQLQAGTRPCFEVEWADQGAPVPGMVARAREEQRPIQVVVMDIRMPPGMDGVRTTQALWQEDNRVQVILCSAYADYDWSSLRKALPQSDAFLVLRKPFDRVEMQQAIHALARKWTLAAETHQHQALLESTLSKRESELDEARNEVREAMAKQLVAESAAREGQKFEALGQMAGAVAHDFNNLLTAIIGFSRFTLDSLPADHNNRADLEQVLKAAGCGAELATQLLSLSRRRPLNQENIDLNEAIRGMELLVRRTLGEDVQTSFALGTTPVPITFDRSYLHQIVLNLVLNARHALGCGGQVSLSTTTVDVAPDELPTLAPGRYAQLAITDNGAGIPAEALPRVLEPFFSTKGEQGNGLGLSTCHSLITQVGGDLQVHSTEGEGTTVTVLWPRASALASDSPEPAVPPHVSADDAASPPSLSRSLPALHALVVDDQEPLAMLMTRALEGAGYQVSTCYSAEQALSLWREHQADAGSSSAGPAAVSDPKPCFDFVVSDVILPGLSGFDLREAARELQPNIPVLLVSGYLGDRKGKLASHEACNAFLGKPFSCDALIHAVEDLLQKSGVLTSVQREARQPAQAPATLTDSPA